MYVISVPAGGREAMQLQVEHLLPIVIVSLLGIEKGNSQKAGMQYCDLEELVVFLYL